MALPTTAVYEIRTTGNDSNGGGFNSARGGTDYTLQDAAQATGTVSSATTTVTAITGIFTAAMVGNFITDGTIWREITAFTSSTVVTVDSAPSWTTATIFVGGALASIGGLGKSTPPSGFTAYIKSGTYSISSSTGNVNGGVYAVTASGLFVGYNTNRTLTNTDTKPTLQATTTSVAFFSDRSAHYNLILDGNSQTGSTVQGVQGGVYDLCGIINMKTATATAAFSRCYATGNSVSIFPIAYGCEAYGNTATPFSGATFFDCLSYGNTGASTDGFALSGAGNLVITANCHSYNNGRNGYFMAGSQRGILFFNSHAENNASYGIDTNTNGGVTMVNCSTYNNTSGGINASTTTLGIQQIGMLTPSASVYTNAAGNDFSLNNTAGAGALLRAAGAPTLFPRGLTANYGDIGATQHQDSGGGGSVYITKFVYAN